MSVRALKPRNHDDSRSLRVNTPYYRLHPLLLTSCYYQDQWQTESAERAQDQGKRGKMTRIEMSLIQGKEKHERFGVVGHFCHIKEIILFQSEALRNIHQIDLASTTHCWQSFGYVCHHARIARLRLMCNLRHICFVREPGLWKWKTGETVWHGRKKKKYWGPTLNVWFLLKWCLHTHRDCQSMVIFWRSVMTRGHNLH